MARPDLLVSAARAVSWRQRLATDSPVTGQMAAARREQQDTGIKEPR
jgi:hypothetical protein